jgi:hypothetical protein
MHTGRASATSFTLPSHQFVKNDVVCSQLLTRRNTASFTLSPELDSLSIAAEMAPLAWGTPSSCVFGERRGVGGIST